MKKQWEAISAKVLTLSLRERFMVLAALLALVWVVFDLVFLAPLAQKQKVYGQEVSSMREEVSKLKSQQTAIVQAAQVDPDAGVKARLAEMQQRMVQMDTDLRQAQHELVAPDRMPKLLQSLLQKDRQIKLVALTTLQVAGLMDGVEGDKTAGSPALGIYKHGFEVTLEGGYIDLMRYVAALEASPWHMLWSNISLQAGAYPQSTLKLTLYTLSLDQAWLSI